MNRLILVGALFLSVVPLQAETMQQWVDAGPQADVTFSPWQPSANTNSEDLPLAQGIYGYIDLSKLPPAEFPIRARLLYTPAQDFSSTQHTRFSIPNRYAVLPDGAIATSPRYVEETTIDSPEGARALPIWNSPFIFRQPLTSAPQSDSEMENVRLEVIGQSGTLLARRLIGASTWNRLELRAVVISSSDTIFNSQRARALQDNGAEAILAPSLVPDDFALINVGSIWIDSSTVSDPALTDAYWRRVLLGGTTVAGNPGDIAALAARLGVNPTEMVLNGRLLPCTTPADLRDGTKWHSHQATPRVIAKEDDPFYLSVVVGKAMNLQLISFSRWYLGIFLVLQVVLIIVAFTKVRGQHRVWLWVIVPLFAILYALGGALLAVFFVHYRAEAMIDQIERQREGWPEAQVITAFSHLNLDGKGTSARFPADSRPVFLVGAPRYPDPGADVVFRRDDAGSQLETFPLPAKMEEMFVRSWVPARAPILMASDGRITSQRSFSGAWFWNGASWADLGPLQAGQSVALDAAKPINPGWWNIGSLRVWAEYFNDFPGFLKPLFLSENSDALTAQGESIFFGVEPGSDYTIDHASSYLVNSRRVVAYQFHLPKVQP